MGKNQSIEKESLATLKVVTESLPSNPYPNANPNPKSHFFQ